jgi:hypothetical protein
LWVDSYGENLGSVGEREEREKDKDRALPKLKFVFHKISWVTGT